jgi:hypothetical protein
MQKASAALTCMASMVILLGCGPEDKSKTPDAYKGFIDGTVLDSKFLSGVCPTATSATARCTSYIAQKGFAKGEPVLFYNLGGFNTLASTVPAIKPSDLKAAPNSVAYQLPDGACTGSSTFDPLKEAYANDRQFPLFNALPLPARSGAVPTWPFVNVRKFALGGSIQCNDIKAASSIGTADAPGKFGAVAEDAVEARLWAVIDPAFPLTPGSADFKPERYGWYNNLLLTYLDGGPIPANAQGELQAMEGVILDPAGSTAFARPTDSQAVLLQFKKGEPGFSPIVKLRSFRLPAGKVLGDYTGICASGMNCGPKEVNLTQAAANAVNTIFIVSQ